MPEYRISLAKSAVKELDNLDSPIAQRVRLAIRRLSQDPRPPGCVKLTGSVNDWRIRIGDWRVVYTIDDRLCLVDIAAVRHRRDVYR
jgi:mRNA interferase RelE/StbE